MRKKGEVETALIWRSFPLRFSLLCFVPVILVALLGKAVRIHMSGDNLAGSLHLFLSDIFFYGAVIAVLLAGLSTKRPRIGLLVIILAVFVWINLLFIEIAGNIYQGATGDTGFDYQLIAYAFANVVTMVPQFAVEVGLIKIASLFALGFAYLGFVIWLIVHFRRAPEKRYGLETRRTRYGTAGLALLLLWVAHQPLSGLEQDSFISPQALSLATLYRSAAIWDGVATAGQPIRQDYPTHAKLSRSGPVDKPPPNVIFIILESTRAQSVAPYSDRTDITPFLAELADQSLVANEAYSIVSHTSKALVAILCGVEPTIEWRVRESEFQGAIPATCLPKLFSDSGYHSIFFSPEEGAFEGRSVLIDNLGFDSRRFGGDMDTEGFSRVNYFGFEDRMMLAPLRTWLTENQENPFFMTLLTITPHHDYRAPGYYGYKDFAEKDALNRYLNSVHYLDGFTRELFDMTKELGVYDNTIFVVLGDHGEAFGEHNRNFHDTVPYNEVLQTPLIIHDGRKPEKKRVTAPVSQMDILPSLVGMAGFDLTAKGYAGMAFDLATEGRVIYSHCFRIQTCSVAIQDGWKYIHHYGSIGDELFHLANDPEERHNLILTEKQIAAAMHLSLMNWLESVAAYHRRFYEQTAR